MTRILAFAVLLAVASAATVPCPTDTSFSETLLPTPGNANPSLDGSDGIWSSFGGDTPLVRPQYFRTAPSRPTSNADATCCNYCCDGYDQNGNCTGVCQSLDNKPNCDTSVSHNAPYCAEGVTSNGQPAVLFTVSGIQPNNGHSTSIFHQNCKLGCHTGGCVHTVSYNINIQSDNPIPDQGWNPSCGNATDGYGNFGPASITAMFGTSNGERVVVFGVGFLQGPPPSYAQSFTWSSQVPTIPAAEYKSAYFQGAANPNNYNYNDINYYLAFPNFGNDGGCKQRRAVNDLINGGTAYYPLPASFNPWTTKLDLQVIINPGANTVTIHEATLGNVLTAPYSSFPTVQQLAGPNAGGLAAVFLNVGRGKLLVHNLRAQVNNPNHAPDSCQCNDSGTGGGGNGGGGSNTGTCSAATVSSSCSSTSTSTGKQVCI